MAQTREMIEYDSPRRRVESADGPSQAQKAVVGVLALVFIAAWWLAILEAGDEPYNQFRFRDFAVQVLLAAALSIVDGAVMVWVMLRVFRRDWNAAWLCLLPFGMIASVLLAQCAYGYLCDACHWH